jgi:hypothetical protein
MMMEAGVLGVGSGPVIALPWRVVPQEPGGGGEGAAGVRGR